MHALRGSDQASNRARQNSSIVRRPPEFYVGNVRWREGSDGGCTTHGRSEIERRDFASRRRRVVSHPLPRSLGRGGRGPQRADCHPLPDLGADRRAAERPSQRGPAVSDGDGDRARPQLLVNLHDPRWRERSFRGVPRPSWGCCRPPALYGVGAASRFACDTRSWRSRTWARPDRWQWANCVSGSTPSCSVRSTPDLLGAACRACSCAGRRR